MSVLADEQLLRKLIREEASSAVAPVVAQVAAYASAAARHKFRYECASAGSQSSVRDENFKSQIATFYGLSKDDCMILPFKVPARYVIGVSFIHSLVPSSKCLQILDIHNKYHALIHACTLGR